MSDLPKTITVCGIEATLADHGRYYHGNRDDLHVDLDRTRGSSGDSWEGVLTRDEPKLFMRSGWHPTPEAARDALHARLRELVGLLPEVE